MTEVTQPCSSCGSDASAQTYDSRGLIASRTDFRGNVTRFERDARALVTSITQSQGTPVARTEILIQAGTAFWSKSVRSSDRTRYSYPQ